MIRPKRFPLIGLSDFLRITRGDTYRIRSQPKNAMVFVHLTAALWPPDLGFIDHDYPLLAIFQTIKPTDIHRHDLYFWPFLGSHRIAKMEEPSNFLIL